MSDMMGGEAGSSKEEEGVDGKPSQRTSSREKLSKEEQSKRMSSRRHVSRRNNRRNHSKESDEKHRIEEVRKHQFDDFKQGYGEVPTLIILPDSPFRMYWDMAIFVFVLYYSISVPFRIAYIPLDTGEPDYAALVIDYSAYIIFSIDIIFNFCTAVRRDGVIVTAHKDIAWDYAQGWLIIDVAATLPLDAMFKFDSSTSMINKLFRLYVFVLPRSSIRYLRAAFPLFPPCHILK